MLSQKADQPAYGATEALWKTSNLVQQAELFSCLCNHTRYTLGGSYVLVATPPRSLLHSSFTPLSAKLVVMRHCKLVGYHAGRYCMQLQVQCAVVVAKSGTRSS